MNYYPLNEDTLRSQEDYAGTHNDYASPYYDGPIIGEDCCEHAIGFDEECEDCLPWCSGCQDRHVDEEGEVCELCYDEERKAELGAHDA